MNKLFYVLAATAVFGLAVPTMASAETIVIKRHGMHDHHHHAHGWHRHDGWHRPEGRHHRGGDSTVIIKRDHRDY